jgi:hypothetical protein
VKTSSNDASRTADQRPCTTRYPTHGTSAIFTIWAKFADGSEGDIDLAGESVAPSLMKDVNYFRNFPLAEYEWCRHRAGVLQEKMRVHA